MATELHEEIKAVIENYDITVINTIEEFDKIITRVEEDGGVKFKPNNNVNENVMIIFDNESYNSAYLHEHFDVAVKCINDKISLVDNATLSEEEFEKVNTAYNTTKVYYVNSPELSNTLMKDFYTKELHLPFDNNCLILFFNHEFDEVFIDAETFQQITAHNFLNAFNIINDTEAINDMLTHIELTQEKHKEGSDSCVDNIEEN